jgi:putative addiction module component (TIGR02574 family)
MNAIAKRLLSDALALSDADRAELAVELIGSLDRDVDEDTTAAWQQEIERRVAELDDRSVSAIPWTEARRMIMGQADAATGR